jgi:hypothetical protein
VGQNLPALISTPSNKGILLYLSHHKLQLFPLLVPQCGEDKRWAVFTMMVGVGASQATSAAETSHVFRHKCINCPFLMQEVFISTFRRNRLYWEYENGGTTELLHLIL